MSAIRVTMNTGRPGGRVYVFGRRCHHGLVGTVLAVIGAALAWHDRHDFKTWLGFHDAG